MPHVNSIEVRDRLIAEFAAEFPHPAALLTAAFPRLVMAARFYGQTDDDLDSLGWLSVVKASARFDESRGVRKTTYYAQAMRFDLLYVLKREGRATPVRGYGFGPGGRWHDDDVLDLLETATDRRDFEGEIDTRDEASRVFGVIDRTLTRAARDVLYGYYGVGGRASETELERITGLKNWAIARTRENAMAAVRRRLGVVA